ncbi:uncharacterized protein LOC113777366 [Coffea eugenioides]|uniref:uncharacterized protein LOC113777366 n=1 Tax=Coffea eugenioides TaxID=49369 RepID=UPI000F6062FE|nr:uncharacterized protein LOC113777366 [Coffea eugenioides]
MRAFPFSLKDAAKDWFYYLPPGSITTWEQLKKKFLQKYFPASRAASLRKEICGIAQHSGESLYDYWERFKKLCTRCPQHQISKQLLIQYFYEGLLYTDRNLIDAASGGVLMNKTSQDAWKLIERMAENSQQFGTREDVHTRQVNEVTVSSIQQQISKLTSAIRQLVVGDLQQAKTCGICKDTSHLTDWCPVLQDERVEQVTMAGNMQYDPYSNTYTPNWRDHSNFSYGGNKQQNSLPNKQQGFQPWYPSKSQSHSSNADMSLEDMVKALVANTTQLQQNATQYQQRTDTSIKNIENQLSQMTSTLHRLESQEKGRLPSQFEVNPKNVSAMTLRSGKEIKWLTVLKDKGQDQIQKEMEDGRRELASTLSKWNSPIYEELPSQTIIDLKKD